VLPIPVGPALSVGAAYSYLPYMGNIFYAIEGQALDDEASDGNNTPCANDSTDCALQRWGLFGRLYPNHQARGAFASFGYQHASAVTSPGADAESEAGSARVSEDEITLARDVLLFTGGLRADRKWYYSGLEIGFAIYGDFDIDNFDDEDENEDDPDDVITQNQFEEEDDYGAYPLPFFVISFSFGIAFM
jgi:hypothetical protein